MMNKATISADIVSSTSLNVEQRLILEKEMVKLLAVLEKTFGSKMFFGRLIKGDYIECVLTNPKLALRVALLIKSFIKALDIKAEKPTRKGFKDFKEYGIRIAIGIGKLSIWDKKKGIIDGEAIYLSGRAVNEMTTSDKKIKNTLVFKSNNEHWNESLTPMFNLLDVLFTESTRAQCEIVFYKLLNQSEKEISGLLQKSQSTINQHSKAVGWYAIESAVVQFERIIT
ncbi:MAG: RNA polymerase subunit sigma-70 [Candidatus Symbiothrix sp.]|jgi:hypothetical protein|nr:RNA polymerase subunit sigma-70 [Candidatus Symbiothrix sp.]